MTYEQSSQDEPKPIHKTKTPRLFHFFLNSTFFLLLGMVLGIAIGFAFLSGKLQVSLVGIKNIITFFSGLFN